MKKLIAFTLALTALISCGKQNRAKLSGTFCGTTHVSVMLEEITLQGKQIVDTTTTNEKGAFTFRIALQSSAPTFYNILVDDHVIPLLITPGDDIQVNSLGDLDVNYTLKGSFDSELIRTFRANSSRTAVSLDSLSRLYTSTDPDPSFDQRRRELIGEYTQLFVQSKREHIAFVVENATSLASLYALYQRLPNNEPIFDPATDWVYFRMVADSLETRYPSSSHVSSLCKEIEDMEKAHQLQTQLNEVAQDARSFPEISLSDMYNKTQTLSSLEGDVILLDFWVPVQSQQSNLLNSEYKELYEQYKERGFEIYQVALTDNRAVWVNTVQSQKLPWISVIDTDGPGGVASMSYAITGVPSNVLIDKEGNIVARNLVGESLTAKIKQLTR